MLNGLAKIDCVPVDDRSSDKIEAGCSIALVFKRPVNNPALLMKKNGLSECVAGFPLI